MPVYTAVIHARLETDSPQMAQELAQEIATQINDDSFTDCAKVVSVEPA